MTAIGMTRTGLDGQMPGWVMVPPGAPHTFANATDEPTVLLNTFTPDFYVGYLRDLYELVSSGRPMTPEARAEVMARYATEVSNEYAH